MRKIPHAGATPRARNRKRGTASVRCPQCKRPSRVVHTEREDDGVLRRRRCARGHLFRTMERFRS